MQTNSLHTHTCASHITDMVESMYVVKGELSFICLYLPLQPGELQTPAACSPPLPTRGPAQYGRLWRDERQSREWRQRQHIDSVRWARGATLQLSLLPSTGAMSLQRARSTGSHRCLVLTIKVCLECERALMIQLY